MMIDDKIENLVLEYKNELGRIDSIGEMANLEVSQ
jgi:hypothetical protein